MLGSSAFAAVFCLLTGMLERAGNYILLGPDIAGSTIDKSCPAYGPAIA